MMVSVIMTGGGLEGDEAAGRVGGEGCHGKRAGVTLSI